MKLLHKKSGEGESKLIVDHVVQNKLNAEETNSAYAVAEIIVPPLGGPPLHKHEPQESFYIIEGVFEFSSDSESFMANKGDFVHVPSNVPHTFKNIGASDGKMLGWLAPTGMEKFFDSVGKPYNGEPLKAKKPSLWQMLKFGLAARKYGISFVKPKKEIERFD